ncbi:hypothetical protein [Flexivirga sp.]|uniref:hypothetical protein n=1 Tax=Flexivirga sp. TaxID=1962927 RepID=UPI003F7F7107
MSRRLVLSVLAVCALVLLPWTTYLGRTLPATHLTDDWRLAWVGFDVGLIVLLLAALWSGHRWHPWAASAMVATATVLVCDAWFDVVLDWGSADAWASIASAVLVELPLAVALSVSARRLLSGGMPRHVVTAEEIRSGWARHRHGPMSLERPALETLSPADRATVDAFYEEKVQQELRLFAWAAARHADFGEQRSAADRPGVAAVQ